MSRSFAALALVLAVLGGCRFSFDKTRHRGGFPPRTNAEVHVVVDGDDEATNATAQRWLEVNESIASVRRFGPEFLVERERVRPGDRLEAACREAQSMGADYIVRPHGSVTFEQDYTCTRYKLTLDKSGGDDCVEGHFHNKRSIVTVQAEVTDTGTCRSVPGVSFTHRVSGEEEVSRAEAERILGRATEDELRGLAFPWQATVAKQHGPPTAVLPEGAEPLEDGDVLAVFRGRRYLGLARAAGHGASRKRIDAMTCCFDPRAGDVLQERGPYHLIDIGVGLGLAQLGGSERESLLGVGWHLRRYPIDGGWMLGLGGAAVGDDNDLVNLATVEAGWLFKVLPGLDLGALGGVGMAVAQHDDDDPEVAIHISASLAAIVNPLPWLYLQADIGLATSTEFEGDGIGGERSLRGAVGQLGVGIEFH